MSFSDLITGSPSEQKNQGDPAPLHFSINNIEIRDGSINFHDLIKEKDHQVLKLNLAIPSISNQPSSIESYVQPAFSALINGTPTSVGGMTKPFADSLATEVDIKMQGINIPEYLAYIPNPTPLTVQSALLDIDTKLSYLSGGDEVTRLSLTGTVTLKSVNIVDREGQTYLKLPLLTVVLGDSNLLNKDVYLTEITIDTPHLTFFRTANGDILPIALLETPSTDESPPTAEKSATKAQGAPEVQLTLERFNLEKGTVLFSDQSLQTPTAVEVGAISLQASNLSTLGDTTGEFTFAMLLNGKGRIKGGGTLGINPLALGSSLAIDSVTLKDFQPYVAEVAKIIIAGGTAALEGNIEVKQDQAGAIAISFSGQGSVSELATIDTKLGDDLLQWKDLQVKNIRYSSLPPELAIEEINWQDLSAQVMVDGDGTINLASLGVAKQNEQPPAPTEKTQVETNPEAGATTNISIATISLDNGRIQFLDKSIQPAYGADLSQLSGTITGLSSQPESRAMIHFDGKVDQQSPLTVSGQINPLSKETFADIKLDFSDFNLSPLSPYTGKYIGQKTSKGKLNLDLSYAIRGKALDSTNKAKLDQFTLGEKVDSPDATSLPVNLAISLLKNRQGEILLDVPVSGNLDDPEFSIAQVVIQVIVNLITKASTSPLALLGSLIPEGVDIQHISFEPGSSILTDEAMAALEVAAKVLYERPGLQMEISGQFDRSNDRAALARQHMEKQIKLAKLNKTDIIRKGNEIDYQSITVSQEEYPQYLEQVYQESLKTASADEKLAAAQKAKPADQAVKLALMEDFIITRINIADEDLRLLAFDRANRVLGNLVEQGPVEADRLFVVEPQTTDDSSEPTGPMAELTIK